MANALIPPIAQPVQNQPIVATNNPQNNVAQTNSGISPITIPIQIQPQVAQQPIYPQANTAQQLQTNNQNYSVPTPQLPQQPVNNNKVDFNQIYSQYQSQYGTNPANNNINSNYSGIKKTSLGTTIVTPTVTNINSVEGQYQSQYADTINSVISELLTKRPDNFQYDPTKDISLRMASEYAVNSTLNSLAGSGVLNSTATAERVARIVSELIPQYENKAYDRYIEGLNYLADTAQLVMNFDSQQFQYWKDAKDREFEQKQFEYQKEQNALENAWKRVDELGFVDNKASSLLGIAVGTLSKDAREAKEQREYELKKMKEQAELEYQNNLALYKIKAELDYQNDLKLYTAKSNMDYQNELALYKEKSNIEKSTNKEMAEYEYKLAQKYGQTTSNSNSKSNISTYDDVIKNRFAQYDDVTKQYIIPNQATYEELFDYLYNLRLSGQITDSEYAVLSAKYSTYVGAKKTNTSVLVDSAKALLNTRR